LTLQKLQNPNVEVSHITKPVDPHGVSLVAIPVGFNRKRKHPEGEGIQKRKDPMSILSLYLSKNR
jgi:hypothetical protein